MLMLYINAIDTESDKIKFEHIYRKYEDFIFNIAFSYFKNKSDAEDATHNSFLRIAKYLDKFDEVSSYKTKGLIYKITKNFCIDSLRKQKRTELLPLEEIELISPVSESAEAVYIDNEELNNFLLLIRGLKGIYREVLTLKLINKFSYSEISDMLSLDKQTVRKRFQRAKELLIIAYSGKEQAK